MNTFTPSIAPTIIPFCFAAGYAEVAPAEPVKNIVLVHGAFADGSSWAKEHPPEENVS